MDLIAIFPELQKFGPAAQAMLYIQIVTSPNHYLVIVVTDEQFRFALISTKTLGDSTYTNLVMEDIAWLDVDKIQGGGGMFRLGPSDGLHAFMGQARTQGAGGDSRSSSRCA